MVYFGSLGRRFSAPIAAPGPTYRRKTGTGGGRSAESAAPRRKETYTQFGAIFQPPTICGLFL